MHLNQNMGFLPGLLEAGTAVAGALVPKNTGGAGVPGISTMPDTTISPTFQQRFTAQVSPVISPIIGSPGAQTAGSPAQIAAGAQEAAGGGAPGGGFPYAPSPTTPTFRDEFDVSRYAIPEQPLTQRAPVPWVPLVGGAVGLVALGTLIYFMTQPRRRGATRR